MSEQSESALSFLLEESKSLLSVQSRLWREKPVTFKEFVVKHLKGELSERQLFDALMIFGNDPERSFTGGAPYHILCLMAGKGSGKDTLASYMIVYCYYLCLCMNNPQEFFGFSVMDTIDMLIISYTEEQARDVNFYKVKQLFLHWEWLKENYTIVEGEKIINQPGKPQVLLLSDKIETRNGIRIKAEHSKNESYEGYNILFWIMSEASAFEGRNKGQTNGGKIFGTLRSSSSSRFLIAQGWKGFVCSFPRYDKQTDFTYQLVQKATEDNDIYADTCYPWEFKPARYFPSGKFFDFEGIKVPIELQNETADSAQFRKYYLCDVPDTGEKAFPIDVFGSAYHNLPILFTTTNEIRRNENMGKDLITAIFHGLDSVSRFHHDFLLTVDLGEKFAATGIALQHYDQERGYILDAVGSWTPIVPERKDQVAVPVDMEDVMAKLVFLGKLIPNVKIGHDQWNKLILQTTMSKYGIKTLEYHLYDQDYDTFRKALSFHQAWIIDDPDHELVRQFNALTRVGRDLVLNQSLSRRKDVLDSVVGGFKVLMSKPHIAMGIEGGVYVDDNLSQFGGEFVPMAPKSTQWGGM